MADELDKIRKLMALALNNPNAEEARSAALKAVQLIQAGGFVIASAQPRVSPLYPDLAAFQRAERDRYQSAQAQAQAQSNAYNDLFAQWWQNHGNK